MREAPKPFWMVVGDGPPTVRHPSKNAAEREAHRLASYNPGVEFYVVRSMKVFCKVDVKSFDIPLDDDEIPF
jgi:hypothetical protein